MTKEEAEKILTHGEWFYAESFDGTYRAIFKYDELISGGWFDFIKFIKCVALVGTVGEYYESDSKNLIRIDLRYAKELRPATKKEIIRYFKHEIPEEEYLRIEQEEFMKMVIKQHENKELLFYTKPTPPRKRPITRNKRKHILR